MSTDAVFAGMWACNVTAILVVKISYLQIQVAVGANPESTKYCKMGSFEQRTLFCLQAAFCVLPSRELLVVTSQKGIQVSLLV